MRGDAQQGEHKVRAQALTHTHVASAQQASLAMGATPRTTRRSKQRGALGTLDFLYIALSSSLI